MSVPMKFDVSFMRRFNSISESLKSIAQSLHTIAKQPVQQAQPITLKLFEDDETPTWAEIMEVGSLTRNGVCYTITSLDDEKTIKVEAVPVPLNLEETRLGE